MPIIAGQITGSVLSGSLSYTFLSNIPSGIVSGAAQVAPLLPAGTVSSSGQVDYNSITNKLSGVVSSSTQVQPLLPGGTVSASNQVDITATTNYSTFSSSLATVDVGQTTRIDNLASLTSSYAINSTIQGQLAGVVSSSTQVQPLLPGGTVSSSGQVSITATTGYSTFSSSIATKNNTQDVSIGALNAATSSYAVNATIQGQLAGVVSSSAQVKPLLPADTVSSSGQVSITATTGYSTFSSSIATKNDTQDVSINALNAATSSYAINATIQGQLANVVSSSTQVQRLLPGGTVSASGQVDITATTNYSTFSSSLATVDAGQTTRIDNLASLTSSYAINSTIQGQLANVVSSSAQVKPLLPGGTVSASGQVVVQNTTGIGALATTGSNTFTANQTITGSLFISQNLTVLGSSSISYISQSTLNIGTNVITMNTNTPGTRFGGIEVIDSGSSPLRSGSLYFDSINDQWIFVHQNTAGGVTSSVVVMGPQTFNNIGNETLLTQNRVLKSNGLEHITDSQISDNGVTVSITNGLSVGTNLTASNATISGLTANQAVFTDANDTLVSVATTGTGDVVRAVSPTLTGTLSAANITATGTMLLAGIISQSSQVSLTGTTGYSTFSSSIATKNDLQDVSINALNAATSSYAINSTIQGQLAGVVSSSTQVKPLLPGGTVSSSAQYPGWVTASSQIDYNSITNKLSGVYSSSAFISPSQGTARLTLNGVALTDVDLGVQTVDQVTFAGVTSSLFGTASLATNVLTANVVSSSTQVTAFLPTGTISSSNQVDYNSITNKLSGVVSSSTQVQPLLPGGTVSASNQVDITATTGYSTFSSSIATKNNLQDVSITALNAATSSYAINSTIQGQLAGVVSSSTQVKPLLPGGTVSASGQVDITATTGYSTFSSSLATIDAGQTTRIDNLASLTSSYAINSTIQGQLAGVISSSAQTVASIANQTIAPTAVNATNVNSTAVTASGLSANQAVFTNASDGLVSNAITGTGNVVMSASPTLTGTLTAANITANGTLLLQNIVSQSSSPSFTGLTSTGTVLLAGIYSSSAQTVAAIANQTIAPTNVNATNILSGSVLQTGTNALIGGKLAVTGALEVTGTVTASNLTANQAVFTNASDGLVSNAITGTGNVVMSASPTLTGTLTAANITANGTLLLQGIYSSSTQVDYNSIQNKLSGVVSSSAQVQPLLPGGTVSSSAQYPGWVTASSQIALSGITGTTFAATDFTFPNNLTVGGTITAEKINTEYVSASVIFESGSSKFGDTADDVMSVTGSIRVLGGTISGSMVGMFSSSAQVDYNSITNKLSGVVSSSAQVQPLLPGGTVSSSGQVDYNSITNKLSGVVSSSTQIATLLPASTVSSSTQVVAGVAAQTIAPTNVNATNILSGSVLQTGTNALIGGKLAVTGSTEFTGTVTASNLNASQAVFTNASDGLVSNAITGTGNVVMSASPTLTGTLTAANITANGTLLLQNIVSQSSSPSFTGLTSTGTVLLAGIYSSSAQTVAAIASQTIAPTTVNATSILSSSVLQTGTNALIGGKLAVTGALEVTGTVTASNLTANQAVFTNAVDGLVSNAITGTGNVVMSTSPTLVTPILGTPTSVTLTNATGLPVSTGISGLGTGVATFLATPSSANLASAVTDETGTGALVFANSPTLVTPALGTPSSATLTNATGLPVSTGISGLGTGVATFLATPSSANLAAALTDETGTGANVFAGSPTLTGTVTADKMVLSGSQFAGIVSGSGLQYRLVVPVGTNQYAT